MSYNYVIGRECVEWAIGKQWTFSRFSRLVWEELGREGRRMLPDPLDMFIKKAPQIAATDAEVLRELHKKDDAEREAAKKEKRPAKLIVPLFTPLSVSFQEHAYATAVRYSSAGSPELNQFLLSHEGQSHLFYLLLRKHHPDIDAETAWDVYWDLTATDGEDGRLTPDQIIAVCNGKAPEPAQKKTPLDSSTSATPTGAPSTGPT